MIKWSLTRKLLILFLSLALAVVIIIPGYKMEREREIQKRCRLRLEQVVKAQENYFARYGRYASEPSELSEDNVNLVCPQRDTPFTLELTGVTNYKVTCPNGHGWASSQGASWKKEE